jgi:DNA-binding winged helix-turn-helix (wHTH) protein
MTYAFERFRFDARTGRLSADGAPLPLGAKSAALLRLLLASHPGVASRAAIAAALWPRRAVHDANVAQQIWLLRNTLGDARLIAAVPRHGYCIAARVHTAGDGDVGAAPDRATRLLGRLGAADLRDADALLTRRIAQNPAALGLHALRAVVRHLDGERALAAEIVGELLRTAPHDALVREAALALRYPTAAASSPSSANQGS